MEGNVTFTEAMADSSAAHGAAQHAEGFNFVELLEHKVANANYIELPGFKIYLPQFDPVQIGGLTLDLSISKHLVFLILAGVVLLSAAMYAVKQNKKNRVPRGWGNALEAIVVFIRDEIVIANMGRGGLRYLPYLISLFLFILLANLFGLVPYGALATSNLAVTAGLAGISFVMIQYAAIRSQGLGHYLAHLTGGVPWFLWPIMIPVEILGLFTKPFALAMRLFANMLGGKIVASSFLGLILFFGSWFIAPVPLLFTLGIYMLELLVAFIQAYIFTLLTALFMGFGMVQEHSEHHESNEHA